MIPCSRPIFNLCNRKTFVTPEHRAAMTKNWENQFVNVKLVGRAMVVTVLQRQNVAATTNVEIMRFVSLESAHASKDSRETFQICKYRNSRYSTTKMLFQFMFAAVCLDRAAEQYALSMPNVNMMM